MSHLSEITLDEPVVITTDSGQTYRAEVEEGLITISYEDNERWLRAGAGAWDGFSIVDCDADLGEDGYELLNEAISAALAD
jgi:hypothetical protein